MVEAVGGGLVDRVDRLADGVQVLMTDIGDHQAMLRPDAQGDWQAGELVNRVVKLGGARDAPAGDRQTKGGAAVGLHHLLRVVDQT